MNIEGISGRGVGTSVEISRILDSYVYKQQQQQQQTEILSSLGSRDKFSLNKGESTMGGGGGLQKKI